jgi:hypothetical protein
MNERVNTVLLLLGETLLSNWQNELSQLPEDHIWDQNLFQEALRASGFNYCSSMARQELQQFMKKHMGLPSRQMTTTLLGEIQKLIDSYLTYLGQAINLMLMTSEKWSILPCLCTYIL